MYVWTRLERARKKSVFHHVSLKKVKMNTVCARVSPRLSPSGPLKMRHSSICPKGENMTRMSFSLHFFDTMPINSFLSSTAKKGVENKCEQCVVKKKKTLRLHVINVSLAHQAQTHTTANFHLVLFDLFFQWPERSLLTVICLLPSSPPGKILFTSSEAVIMMWCVFMFKIKWMRRAILFLFLSFSVHHKDRELFSANAPKWRGKSALGV